MGGFNSLKQGGANNKEFITRVYNLSKQYYKDKKELVKRKTNKLVPGQTNHMIRYILKASLYGIVTNNSYEKTLLRLTEATNMLKQNMPSGQYQNFERRDNADFLLILVLKIYLDQD